MVGKILIALLEGVSGGDKYVGEDYLQIDAPWRAPDEHFE